MSNPRLIGKLQEAFRYLYNEVQLPEEVYVSDLETYNKSWEVLAGLTGGEIETLQLENDRYGISTMSKNNGNTLRLQGSLWVPTIPVNGADVDVPEYEEVKENPDIDPEVKQTIWAFETKMKQLTA
ncbi:hypothetical protein TWF694_005230 [Orbilia ellipsospora]|uniref:Uncharacterized protein n=1 Tax=Orbilia ellipsospora TaxID=2528407 RepID=A0AAV9WUY0_9PEZI